MSKFVGIFRKQRGKVGDFVFRKTGNEYIVSEKPPKKGTSIGTKNQAYYRAQWGNLVRFWQSFRGNDRPSFEGATPNVSHFNLYMRANINANQVFLTKEAVRLGACVVAPYRVTEGQLPVVGLTAGQSGSYESSINLGDLVIGNNTSIKAFSNSVLTNNRDFEVGDQITIFCAFQFVDAANSMPRCIILTYKVELDTEDDTTMLYDVMPSSVIASVEGKFVVKVNGDGGAAIIHSRKTSDGGTLVSTQSMVVSNSLLQQYQLVSAQTEAANSYGIYDRGAWLTPDGSQTLAAN